MQLFLGTGLAADPRGRGPRDGDHQGGQPAPRATRPPALLGAGIVGEPLVVDPGAWTGATGGFGFAWLRDGVAIAGAAGAEYLPAAVDDRAAIACRVTATGPGGATAAVTPKITIAFTPPGTVGPLPELYYTQSVGSHVVDISPFFSGGSLEFSVTGAGVAIDPATGVITLDPAALVAGGVVTVAAANSGGRVAIDLALRIATPPVAIAPPTLAGPAVIGAALVADPGVWAGQPAPELALEWLADGAPVAGGAGASFTPRAAEDGKAISVRVTATNPAGTVAAESAALVAVHAPPAATGSLPDLVLARGAAAATVPAAAAFAGGGLVFAVEGAGASIDAATGAAFVPTDTSRDAAPVVVTATNSGGSAQLGFAVTVQAAPVALDAPAEFVFDLAPGTARIDAAAFFAGDALGFSLDEAPEGVTIDAASGVATVPTAAAFAGVVAVRAANAVGAATLRLAVAARSALAAPVATGVPAAATFLQGTGAQTVSAQAFFAGEGLVYALEAAPAGVTINPGSGLVSVATDAALAATAVTVRASNAAGAATQRVTVTVKATRTVFDAPAALDEVRFLFQSAAPAWSHNARGGFARLSSGANDRAHGDWIHAGGDGRYRALARWSAGFAAPRQSRPFGLIGRMTKTGADFRGVRLDVLLQTTGARVLQVRDYTGSTVAATTTGQSPVAWAWDAWWWLEAEFDGATVRGRLYPEGSVAPEWQVVATTAARAPGAFGPTSHVVVDGQIPVADIRRLEFEPLSSPASSLAPQAPAAGDWTIGQTMVKP